MPAYPLFRYFAVAAALVSAASCGSDSSAPATAKTDGGGSAASGDYRVCTPETRVGEFILARKDEDGYTGFESGAVLDAVEEIRVRVEVMKTGLCRVVEPPLESAPCKPECGGSQICSAKGCVAKPTAQDLGTVTLDGLKVPKLTLQNIDFRYSNPPSSIPHPAFDDGAVITLSATGKTPGYGPFTLKARGVPALQVPKAAILAVDGQPTEIKWTPPSAAQASSRMHIEFSLNLHGKLDVTLECVVPDTGSFTVDGKTISDLFKRGVSGFPRATLTRHTADTAMVKSGCVQFLVTADVQRDITIPGIVSCMDNDECPKGKTCSDTKLCK